MSFDYHNLRTGAAAASSDDQFAQAVLEGLSREPKRLPSWLIYDDRGSEIFTEITQLAGYHPARCELEIFQKHKQTVTDMLAKHAFRVIELGAGDGGKTQILLEHFIQKPADIRLCANRYLRGRHQESCWLFLESRYSQSTMSVIRIGCRLL